MADETSTGYQIQIILDREHEIAKAQLAAGHKDRALVALRRRKYQESLLVKTDGQLESLEQLVSTIEFSLVQASVLHGLKQGNEVLKEIHKQMNVENVEKLLQETSEAQAYQREIDEMLSNTLTLDEEDAVQEELRQLQADAVRQAEPSVDLPNVPNADPIAHEPEGQEIPTAEQARARVAVEA